MSTEDTTKLIEEARSYLLPGDEGSIEWRAVAALESLVAENEKLRGPDSDERDALITDPLIRQIQALRAQLTTTEREAAYRAWEAAVSASRYSYENPDWWINPYRVEVSETRGNVSTEAPAEDHICDSDCHADQYGVEWHTWEVSE